MIELNDCVTLLDIFILGNTTNFTEFENPFSKTSIRAIFSAVYALVFCFCLGGKVSLLVLLPPIDPLKAFLIHTILYNLKGFIHGIKVAYRVCWKDFYHSEPFNDVFFFLIYFFFIIEHFSVSVHYSQESLSWSMLYIRGLYIN